MATIYRYRLGWTGWPGQPGVTTLFAFNDTTEQVFADNARAFMLDALSTAASPDFLPTGITVQGEAIVDHITVEDGTLTDSVPVTQPAAIAGLGSGAFAAPSGACITWLTGAVHAGHRVRGRTYLVPLATTAFDNSGTLATGALTNLRNAASAYIALASNPCVWSRNHPGESDGAAFSISAGTVQDKVAVLTSRRD